MKGRILIIEDNAQNLYLMRFLLEKAEWEVSEAADGREGIGAAERDPPTLIILDIQLPVIDGYEVARRLRACEALASVPIVAVTSYAMVGDRERGLAAGCAGYIEKPIDPRRFVGEVEGVLEMFRRGEAGVP